MVPPQSDPIADYQQQAGYWYSLVDRNGRVLFRRVIATSFFIGPEVFTSNRDEQLYRLRRSPLITTLVLVFPDLADALQLQILGSRQDSAGRLQPAAAMTTFPLKEVKRGRE